jgi:hypothetical protein
MHDDYRLASERTVFFPVDPMLRKSRGGQMAGPDEGRVRRSVSAGVVWRGCLGDFIHGEALLHESSFGGEEQFGARIISRAKSRNPTDGATWLGRRSIPIPL